MVVGGGLAGITAALALADAGRARHAARGPAAAGRARLLLPARRADRRQRPARLPALLHRLPLVPRPDRRRRAGPPAGPARRARSRRGGTGAPARPAAPHRAARAAAPGREPRHLSAPLARRARQGRARRARAQGGSTRPTRRWTRRTSAAGWPRTASRARAIEALWDLVGRRHPQRHRRRRLAGAGRDGLQDRAAVRARAPPTSAGRASRSANCTTRWPARRSTPRACAPSCRTRVTSVSRSRRAGAGASQVRAGETARRRTRVVLAVPQREAHDLLPDGALDDPDRLLRHRHRADPQRPCRLRPQGAAPPVLRRARHPGPVGLRPHRRLRADRRRPVPGAVPVGRAGRDRRARRRAARALSARAGAAAARRPRRRGAGLLRHPGAHSDLRPRPRRRAAAARRPHPAPGLYLAGAWTATGWPATMESAVRSGVSAAGRRADALGRPRARTSSTSRRRRDARQRGGMAPHHRTATRGETVPTVPPAIDGCRRRVDVDRAAGARADPGHAGAARGRRPARTAHGHRRRLPLRLDRRRGPARPTATAARPCAPRSRCCPPRRPAPRPRPACPARSPSSWCTTSRCCTTT